MTPALRDTTAGLGATALQIAGFLTVDFAALHPVADAVLIAPAAFAAYIGLQLALPRPKTVLDEVRELGFNDVDEAEVAKVIETARAQIARLDTLCQELSGERARKVAAVSGTATRIIDGFKEDPSDIKRSRTFLRHYLGGTVELVEKYVRLNHKAAHSDSAREALARFDDGLDEMAKLFQQQYEKNLADDIADFDVHLEVFQTLAKQEGV